MTEALFFHRTLTTRQIDVGFTDPHNLPAAQRLNFTLPDNVWQEIEETFRLNIKKFPIVTAKGAVLRIGVTPVGLKGYSRRIRGYFKDPATGVDTLRVFRKVTPIDSYHEFGVFGIVFSPQASKFDVDGDPDNTFGWTFDSYTLKNLSNLNNKIYDFSIDISFGGILP